MTNNRGRTHEFGSDPSEGSSHPVGKSIGALAGAIAGGAAGSTVGPIGTIGGAAIGTIAGWLEGKTIAEGLNPTEQLKYWETAYTNRPYYTSGRTWKDYEPAYQYGIYSFDGDNQFDDVERELERDWDSVRSTSRLSWSEATDASRDAWNRIHAARQIDE